MYGTKANRAGLVSRSFSTEDTMMPTQSCDAELAALRELERAVRACGLPTMMVSGQKQLDMLAAALQAVSDARANALGYPPRPADVVARADVI